MQYSFKTTDDFSILENISNDELCHIERIRLISVFDFLDQISANGLDCIPHYFIQQGKTPCNLQTLISVSGVQDYIQKEFWPGNDYKIIFPGTKIAFNDVENKESLFFGNFFPGIGMLFGKRLTCIESLDRRFPSRQNTYIAYF